MIQQRDEPLCELRPNVNAFFLPSLTLPVISLSSHPHLLRMNCRFIFIFWLFLFSSGCREQNILCLPRLAGYEHLLIHRQRRGQNVSSVCVFQDAEKKVWMHFIIISCSLWLWIINPLGSLFIVIREMRKTDFMDLLLSLSLFYNSHRLPKLFGRSGRPLKSAISSVWRTTITKVRSVKWTMKQP